MGLIGMMLMWPVFAFAQNQVSGIVLDNALGTPVKGVVVHPYSNASTTTETDENGAYTITVPTGETMLTYEGPGYVIMNSPLSNLTEPIRLWKATEMDLNRMTTCKGIVTDAATGEPMAGVRVQAYNNALYAAMTKEDGSYTIKLPEYVTALTFALDGCNTIVCPIANKHGVADVEMFTDKFSEIYTSKRDATRSKSAQVSSKNADLSVDDQIQNNLMGEILTSMRSGQLGIGASMLVAGINSLNINTQPLVVVDGVIMDMQYDREYMHDGYYNNILSNIMVEDIENIQVLKSGLAIYGAKGANGVILINTKRNKSMATKIDVSLAGSYQLMPKLPDMMNSSQYRSYASELLGSTGTEVAEEYKFLQLDPGYYYYKTYHNETDWSDETYRNAFIQNYSINVQGGDDIANYNLSVGYAQGDATLEENDYSRFNLRLNSDIILSDRISVKFDAAYSDVTRDMRDDGVSSNVDDATITAPGFLSLIKAPFLSPYSYDISGNLSQYLSGNDDYLDEVLGEEVSLANPVAILKNGSGINKNYLGSRLITISITPKFEINRYWSISEHFNYTLSSVDENYYLPIIGTPKFKVIGIGEVENKAAAMATQQNSFMSNTYFNFDKRFNAHDWHVSGGLRWFNNLYKQNSMLGYNSGNDKTPNMSTSLQYKSTAGVDDHDISLTWWAQGNYNYRERYYASVGLGLSASSRFGGDVDNGVKLAGVPWGLFPSASAAWVMSSESWFNVKFIDFLKFNASFDMTGNDGFNDTASRTYFSPVRLLGATGIALDNIGNSTLQWETTTRYSVGFDMNLFKNRLTLSGSVFSSRTDNLLSISRLSYLTGIEESWSNGGKLKNFGFDASAGVKILNNRNLTWEAGVGIGGYRNELVELPDNDRAFNTELYGATVRSQVGSPVGIFYGYETDGVFSTTQEAEAANLKMLATTGNPMNFEAGDVRFVDQNGDGFINEADMVEIGDPNPDFYGRLYTTLTYKGFTLNATLTGSYGGDIFNYQRMILESGSRFMNQTVAMVNRWTCEGQVTDIPSANYGDPMQNSRFSDRWIEDGSYIRLKNVTLSYRIPVDNAIIHGITVWGAANNVVTFTKYLGSDPEFSLSNNILTQGIDRGLLPLSRNFSLGVKINL